MSDEWLTVIIVLLIVGIILDGIRRVRVARRERIVMSDDLPDLADFSNDDFTGSEFPSGGARVAGYRHPEDAANLHENLKKTPAKRPQIPARSSDNPGLAEPSLGNFDQLDDDVAVAEAVVTRPQHTARAAKMKVALQTRAGLQPQAAGQTKAAGQMKAAAQAKPAAQTVPKRTEYRDPQEVIVINVMAAEGRQFAGSHLLQVLTEQNLRWGDMEIFHRHKSENGSGEILFSLANIVKPGTFDLKNMEDFSSPGISMFMTLPIRGDSVAAFGLMARTAKAIAEALGGELKDENRSVMTQQTFEHCRQRVIEFERKRRLAR